MPALILNGTKDPLNPYEGGPVSLFGFGNRGTVRSSLESARFFASQDGYEEKGPVTLFADRSVPVQVRQWNKDGKPRVILYSLMGGGHVIPQPVYRAPRFLGPNAPQFNGPEAIWAFFEKQL